MSEDLSRALGQAILQQVPPAQHDDHLALLRATAAAEHAVHDLLAQSVVSARAAGHSWAELGAELGMTRQAAQQRFGERRDDRDDRADRADGADGGDRADAGDGSAGEVEERWLGPVTAFDEMAELELAGRLGWRTVGAGMLRHRVRRGPTQWEHRRALWSSEKRYAADGWQVGARAFPWVYLVRDTGLPAEDAVSDG
jgi:hypothetical protein